MSAFFVREDALTSNIWENIHGFETSRECNKMEYTCDKCEKIIENCDRYHCMKCENYDLCGKCWEFQSKVNVMLCPHDAADYEKHKAEGK